MQTEITMALQPLQRLQALSDLGEALGSGKTANG